MRLYSTCAVYVYYMYQLHAYYYMFGMYLENMLFVCGISGKIDIYMYSTTI